MPSRTALVKFIKFVCIGGLGLLISLAITYVLTRYVGLWYLLSYTLATFVAWNFVFFTNSLFTFAGHSKGNFFRRYATFMIGYVGLFCLNAGIVFVCTSLLHLYYLLSIIFATGITTILTFLFSKKFVYNAS